MASFTRRFTALAQRVNELIVQIKNGNLIIGDDDVDVDDGDDVDVDFDDDDDDDDVSKFYLTSTLLVVRNQFVILCYRLK